MGICLEARRLDKIQEIFAVSQNSSEELLSYLYELTMKYTASKDFKLQVVAFIMKQYKSKKLEPQEYINFCQCSYFLNDHESMAQTLFSLIMTEKQNSLLLTYQIA